jgi:hypothetical protein
MLGQFSFLVGIATSAVIVVLPYYMHNYKVFGKMALLGQLLAAASVTLCLMVIIVNLGSLSPALNVLLQPTLNSVLFWNMIALLGYLCLNVITGWAILTAERKRIAPTKWVKSLSYVSVLFSVIILTVSGVLFAGFPGIGLQRAAAVARFFASAVASGPAVLILLSMFSLKFAKFNAGWEAIQALAKVASYAMVITMFINLCGIFAMAYTQSSKHVLPLDRLVKVHSGHAALEPWIWLCTILEVMAVAFLINPKTRTNERLLPLACAIAFFALWLEKGISLILAGFVPPMPTMVH